MYLTDFGLTPNPTSIRSNGNSWLIQIVFILKSSLTDYSIETGGYMICQKTCP